jgi:hypothetical protein
MKTDLYTKIVLTVIAFCLCIIVLKDYPVVTKAIAASGPVPVNIVQINGRDFGGLQVSPLNPALPVKVER